MQIFLVIERFREILTSRRHFGDDDDDVKVPGAELPAPYGSPIGVPFKTPAIFRR